jgi:hypothetical protein
MNASFILEMLIGFLRGWIFKSEKAAPYAKWLLRIRDYLLKLFPVEMYPEGGTGDAVLEAAKVSPVPVEAVKKAAKSSGFNIPFIKGM